MSDDSDATVGIVEPIYNFGGPWQHHPFVWDDVRTGLEGPPETAASVREHPVWALLACAAVARSKWRPDAATPIRFHFKQKGREFPRVHVRFVDEHGQRRSTAVGVKAMMNWLNPVSRVHFKSRTTQLGISDAPAWVEVLNVWRQVARAGRVYLPVWDTTNMVFHVREILAPAGTTDWPPAPDQAYGWAEWGL